MPFWRWKKHPDSYIWENLIIFHVHLNSSASYGGWFPYKNYDSIGLFWERRARSWWGRDEIYPVIDGETPILEMIVSSHHGSHISPMKYQFFGTACWFEKSPIRSPWCLHDWLFLVGYSQCIMVINQYINLLLTNLLCSIQVPIFRAVFKSLGYYFSLIGFHRDSKFMGSDNPKCIG